MTIETLRFLRDLVAQQQISAQHPDLMAIATLITRVQQELGQAIAEKESNVLPDL